MLSKFRRWLFPDREELERRKHELQRRVAERKSKSQLEARSRVSFTPERPTSLQPITLSSPACPYCGVIQEPPPMRRRKCRDCGQVIHVRTDRDERKKYLLTAEQANRKVATATRLARERRNQEWKELSGQVQTAMQTGDWYSLQRAYQQQAIILFHEGRPHFHVAQESARAQLMHFLELGIVGVIVRTCDDERVCAHCRSVDGKVFTIQEALEGMPIPGPNCSDGEDQNPHSGRCRCVYESVFPGSKHQKIEDCRQKARRHPSRRPHRSQSQ